MEYFPKVPIKRGNQRPVNPVKQMGQDVRHRIEEGEREVIY